MDFQSSRFPPLVISSADLARHGLSLEPHALHDVELRMWHDMAAGRVQAKKSVLKPDEADLWGIEPFLSLRGRLGGERLGWKLSALSAIGPRYASVKIVGANAVNRLLSLPRSRSTILLLDKFTMAPLCLLEGTEISAARTATYASLIGAWACAGQRPIKVFIFGGGPIAIRSALALRSVLGDGLGQLWVRTRSLETARRVGNQLEGTGVSVTQVVDNQELRQADLVITATNADRPVYALDELGADATVLHLGGDETPPEVLSAAFENGSVFCDDIDMVSERGSQSLALYFASRGLTLAGEGRALGIRSFHEFVLGSARRAGLAHVTCVGLPSLDLYAAEYVYTRYCAAIAKEAPAGGAPR